MAENKSTITIVSYDPSDDDAIEVGQFVSSSSGDLGYIKRVEQGGHQQYPTNAAGEPERYVWIDWMSGCKTEHRVRELKNDGVSVAYLENDNI